MRNITQVLLSLACLSLPVKALAQLEELDHMTISVAHEAAESLTPDTQWYLAFNHMSNDNGVGGFLWDRGPGNGEDNSLFLSPGTSVVYSGMMAKDAAPYLVRFVSATSSARDLHDKYYVQFGTGDYVCFTSNYHDRLFTYADIEDANPAYVYLALDESCYLCVSTTEGDYRMDTYGPGDYVVLAGEGEKEDLSYLGDVWFLFPVELTAIDGRDEALLELESTYAEYAQYRNFFITGTSPGQYSADAVKAFQDALDAGMVFDDPDIVGTMSEEEIRQLSQNIIDTYEAVLASRVSKQAVVADGYYFFNCGLTFEETTEDVIDPETGVVIPGETIFPTKSMYSELENTGMIYAKWKTLEHSCPFLWKVTLKSDDLYEVVNMATDATFDEVATSEHVTMTKGGENLMEFDLGTGEKEGYTFIRVSTQVSGGYYYLHCEDHSNGTGTGGYIVGWSNEMPSAWLLEEVSIEEAEALIEEYEPIKNRYETALTIVDDANAKMSFARDHIPLITSVNQLSSPYTDSSEGSLEALIDGDVNTYWHSDWHSGDVPAGTHYFEVEIGEVYAELCEQLYFVFTRWNSSATNSDHITKWGVYGAPNTYAGKDDCELLAEIATPYGDKNETLTTIPFPLKGYTKLRFYIEDTTGLYSEGPTRGYAHLSEFQLYNAVESETSQRNMMGETYTHLEEAVAVAQVELVSHDIAVSTYTDLLEAYEAFLAVFVDPTPLRDAIGEAKTAARSVIIGTNPGEWTSDVTTEAITSLAEEALAYDKAGVYTQTQSDGYVNSLSEQLASLTASAIKVEEGKWYELRYATVEEIEDNGWNLNDGAPTSSSGELYGKYVAVATLIQESGFNVVEPLTQSDLATVCVEQNLYFEDKNMDILWEDYAKFRFISVGDTAYMIQNKATGLFVKTTAEGAAVTLSVHPTLFNVAALGFGQNVISGVTLSGDNQSNLHAQVDCNVLVTSPTGNAGSNSAFYIEDIGEAVAEDYDGTHFNIGVQPGALNTFCYPVAVTAEAGSVYGVYVVGTTITLAALEDNTAPAGQPFAYVYGDLDTYDYSTETEPAPFVHGYDIEAEVQDGGGLVGSYYGKVIGAGNALPDGNSFSVTTSSSATVPANGAYVSGSYSRTDVLVVEISGSTYDSVENTIAVATLQGNIYNIDGKFLGKGNLNAVKALGRGIYIVNGVKVVVK